MTQASLGQSDITRFRPWSPIAPDRKTLGERSVRIFNSYLCHPMVLSSPKKDYFAIWKQDRSVSLNELREAPFRLSLILNFQSIPLLHVAVIG